MMRKHPALRPHVFAIEVDALLARTALGETSIDLHAEAKRIYERCGVTPATTMRELAVVASRSLISGTLPVSL